MVRYVDDLAIALDDPEALIQMLTGKHGLKLKGTGPIGYHLGCDFFRDKQNTLCMAPKSYVTKAISNYFRMFDCLPKTNVWSPLEKGDHPKLDLFEELGMEGVKNINLF